jgi:hypothetical protein
MVIESRTICCGQVMRALGSVDCWGPNIEKVERWICPVCGRGVDLVEYFLDAEELQNELESYAAMEASPIAHLHIFTGSWKPSTSELERMPGLDMGLANSIKACQRLPRKENLKGGESNMAEENQGDEIATMCATKAGNGFKVVVNGVWYYASKKHVLDLTHGHIKSCVFSTIKDEFPQN